MAFTNHVFISYSHPDNLSVSGKGFVSRLEDALLPYLSNRLKRTPPKIWRDQRLSDNVDFDPVIIDSLKASAVLLAVLTDNYVGPAGCRREASTFCDAAEAGLGLSPGDKARLFKVVMLPPSALDGLPEAMLKQGRGSSFFTRVDKNRRISQDERDTPMPLDPSYGADYESQFNLAVSLLAAEIADSLKALDNAAAGTSTDPKKAFVYLAQCDDDRRADREALRSELLQFGYRVLPDRELPRSDTELRVVVADMLARSVLAIHLLGSGPGQVPSGVREDSDLVIQNELALQRAQVAPLRRLVSLPRGTVCPRERHQKFLDALLTDEGALGQAELIDGDRSKPIEEMHVALKAIEEEVSQASAEAAAQAAAEAANTADAQSRRTPATGAAAQPAKLYMLYTIDDLQATGDLRGALEARYDLSTPVFEGPPDAIRKANEARLLDCDAVLLFWGAGTDAWLSDHLAEVQHALAGRHGRPFSAVLQCVAGKLTGLKKDRVRKPRPNVINALQTDPTAALSDPAAAAIDTAAVVTAIDAPVDAATAAAAATPGT
ncbi:MAG: toll/interleukin-1 receptor domain-containing protein, partial [Microbacteriaceae bacterium]|nr:toll/interleukin-1 receptor domain-containing protein [Burkholderiaceae bacterium]